MRKISWFLIVLIILSAMPFYAFAEAVITPGQYVNFGTYNGEDILWRCLGSDDNGYLMISDKIITVKSFDSAGVKDTDPDGARALHGSDLWSESSLRTWLNSRDTKVAYANGHIPSEENVKDGINDYYSEKGFLNKDNFSPAEFSLIKSVNLGTAVGRVDESKATTGTALHKYIAPIGSTLSNYADAYKTYTDDLVFLPDVTHIEAIAADTTTFGEEYYLAKPTGKAVENTEIAYRDLIESKNYYYWLRDPVTFAKGDNVRSVYNISSVLDKEQFLADGYLLSGTPTVNSFEAYNGSVGVRPMLYLNSELTSIGSGSGTAEEPYVVTTDATYIYLSSDSTAHIGSHATVDVTAVNAPEGATYKYYYDGVEVSSLDDVLLTQERNTFTAVMYSGDEEICRDELTVNAGYATTTDAVLGSVWADGSRADVIIDTNALQQDEKEELAVLVLGSNGEIIREDTTSADSVIRLNIKDTSFNEQGTTIEKVFVWRLKKLIPICTVIQRP